MIYLDNAATTPVLPAVVAAMQPYLQEEYGNASSIHRFGRSARSALEHARATVAEFIGAEEAEIVFTSGGTESIHSALFGAFLTANGRRHIVTTAVEHHAVLHTCEFLKRLGAEVTVVKPSADGVVQVEDIVTALRPDTLLVSAMMVNNETGAVLPVAEIARAVKARDPGVLVHTDMVQALGTVRCRLADTDIDFASFSAHKIHGPKGVGALYVRQKSPWTPVLHGGLQEREKRAGTENVAGIAGFAAAVARLAADWEGHRAHLRGLNERFWNQVRTLPGVVKNSPDDAVPSILNIWFPEVRNDRLLMRLDVEGVAASAGSACTAGSLEPSHVLEAYGYPAECVRQSIRFSFAETNTQDEVQQAAEIVCRVVAALTS